MPSGTATVNFGAWPGSPLATVDVTGQAGLVATSRIESWVLPIDTADHSADEHQMAELATRSFFVSSGTFRIEVWVPATGHRLLDNKRQFSPEKDYGQYSIGWAWSNT